MIEVVRVPAFRDNYIWLLHDGASGETVVVDPGDAAPVLNAAATRGWTIGQIWNTHWHPDHVGGNLEIKAKTGCTVTGPAGEATKIPGIDRAVGSGDMVAIGDRRAEVIEVPAHTAGHIAYHLAADGLLFPGDTLFAMGCGRLFEGTPADMWASLGRLMALPDATQVYCAHEYTAGNARFALTVEPDNPALIERMAAVEAARSRGEATVPTTIGLERATNPFTRASDLAEFARRRAAKDVFQG